MSRKLGTMLRTALLLLSAHLLIALIPVTPAAADDGELHLLISNLSINSDFVSFDLSLEGAFTAEGKDALHKGFATHMAYTVELWRDRGLWFDKLELTKTLTMKVTYDLWSERYVVSFRRDRLAKFDTIDEVRNATCRLQGLKLVDARELDPSEEYYISVRALLRPLTMEEIGELEDWLSGDVPTGGRGILSIPSYLMKMLLGTTGVTDRSTLAKSDVFTVESRELESVEPDTTGLDVGP